MNKKKHAYSKVWGLTYAVHPPIRKVLQVGGRHKARHPYLIGKLNVSKYDKSAMEAFLISIGFERARLAWKEEGELLSMRRVDGSKFQWHIRLFEDGEVRGHYEYAPESNPIKHLRGKVFHDDKKFLSALLGDYLI